METDLVNVQLRLEKSMIEEIAGYAGDEFPEVNRWMVQAVSDFLRQPMQENLETPIITRLGERDEKTRRNIRFSLGLLEDIDRRVSRLNKNYDLALTRTQWIIAALRTQIEVERESK